MAGWLRNLEQASKMSPQIHGKIYLNSFVSYPME